MDSLADRFGPVPFPRFAAEVTDLYRPPLRRKSTFYKISQSLDEFGAMDRVDTTDDITPGLIARWYAEWAPRRKPITNESVLRAFRAACTYAESMGYLRVNPWKVRRDWVAVDGDADEEDAKPKHRSISDVARILERLEAEASGGDWEARRLRVFVAILAYTGMRKMEILYLRPADVDLEHGLIRIRSRSRRRLKTARSAALVGIPRELDRILAPWMAIECGPDSDWLLPNKVKKSSPWTSGPVTKKPLDSVKAAALRAGVPGMTLHMFRHSLASAAGRFGLSPLELKAQLRHTNLTTQNFYLGVDADNARAVASRITYAAAPSAS